LTIGINAALKCGAIYWNLSLVGYIDMSQILLWFLYIQWKLYVVCGSLDLLFSLCPLTCVATDRLGGFK